MKKFIARGASVAFLSAAAILPLAGGAQAATHESAAAATATWGADDHDGRGWGEHRHRRCHFRHDDWWWEGRDGWWGGGHRHHRWGDWGLGWNRGWDWGGGLWGGGHNVVIVF